MRARPPAAEEGYEVPESRGEGRRRGEARVDDCGVCLVRFESLNGPAASSVTATTIRSFSQFLFEGVFFQAAFGHEPTSDTS